MRPMITTSTNQILGISLGTPNNRVLKPPFSANQNGTLRTANTALTCLWNGISDDKWQIATKMSPVLKVFYPPL